MHAPQLYADKLDFTATLVKLPGANNKRSYWELSYQLYFIPEESYWASIRRLPRGGANPSPDNFPGTILIAQGHRKSKRIATLEDRTITLTGLPFKQKVPDALRTKFAVVMTSYAVKIFDAQLNTTVTVLSKVIRRHRSSASAASRQLATSPAIQRDSVCNRPSLSSRRINSKKSYPFSTTSPLPKRAASHS